MVTKSRRRALKVGLTALVATTVLTGSLLGTAGSAAAGPSASAGAAQPAWNPVRSAMLKSGDAMAPGQEIKSANGEYSLRLQLDGNLVLLNAARRPIWDTGTAPNPGATVHMQGDGNLTVRSAVGNKPLWSSGTHHKGATAHVQDDANFTIRTPAGEVLWARR
jgi:hypothetical protein